MKYDSNKHHRRSIRLKGYDYSLAGAYFITICTHQKNCLFGEIIEGEVRLNALGWCVKSCWENLSKHFLNIELDAFVVMPNHLHGILWLTEKDIKTNEVDNRIKTNFAFKGTQSGSVGAIIQNFKSVSTRKINRISNNSGRTVWQRNYYEHIIQNEESLDNIRQYILTNSQSWERDQLHPNHPSHR